MKNAILALVVTLAACATQQPIAPSQPCPADNTINATLWMQTSAEYQAVTREVYATALHTLDEALADKTWTAATEQPAVDPSLPPAIILDIDETILDTSAHQAKLIREKREYSEAGWHEWAMHDASQPIAAAHDFLIDVQRRGIAIFYVTNRLKSEEEPLRATLARLGFPLTSDNVITRGARPEWESSDKTPRRAFVASRHRVLMLFGDDLNDFTSARSKSLAERDAIVRAHATDWGRKWFALPNPVYGSWEGAITRGATGCDQAELKIDALRE
jgi:5'-nucleotidase (lipoprotein e(P4) family)